MKPPTTKQVVIVAGILYGLYYLSHRATGQQTSRTHVNGNTMSQTYRQGPWQNDTSKYK